MIQLVRISAAGNSDTIPPSISASHPQYNLISKPKSETSRYFPPPFPFLEPNRLFLSSGVLAPECIPTEEWRERDGEGVVGKW